MGLFSSKKTTSSAPTRNHQHTRSEKYLTPGRCRPCGGDGTTNTSCGSCSGNGYKVVNGKHRDCTGCNGRGYHARTCAGCNGTGRINCL